MMATTISNSIRENPASPTRLVFELFSLRAFMIPFLLKFVLANSGSHSSPSHLGPYSSADSGPKKNWGSRSSPKFTNDTPPVMKLEWGRGGRSCVRTTCGIHANDQALIAVEGTNTVGVQCRWIS